MEQAENFEQLIKRIAEELTMADHVYYDLNSFEYSAMFDHPNGWHRDTITAISDLSGEIFNDLDL